MVWRKLWTNNKKIGNPKNVTLSKYRNLTIFQDRISELFVHFCGPGIPKWNFAHLEWSKQAKNIRKTSKNSWFTAPCFRTRQTGHISCKLDQRCYSWSEVRWAILLPSLWLVSAYSHKSGEYNIMFDTSLGLCVVMTAAVWIVPFWTYIYPTAPVGTASQHKKNLF